MSAGLYASNEIRYSTLNEWRAAIQGEGCASCEATSSENSNTVVVTSTPGADTNYHTSGVDTRGQPLPTRVGHLCATQLTCGNGAVDGFELCDGQVLAGATCVSLGYSSGTLACAPGCLSYDTTACVTITSDGPGGALDCEDDYLFCDDFEGGSLAYWSDDQNLDQGRLAISTGAAAGQYSATQQHVTGGNGGWLTRFFGDHPLDGPGSQLGGDLSGIPKSSPFWLSVAFDQYTLFVVASFENWAAQYAQPLNWSPHDLIVEIDQSGFPTMTLHRKVGSEIWLGLDQNVGAPLQLQTGQWHSLQVRLRLNSPGQANGVAEMWINGQKKASYTNVNFRSNYTQRGWNHLMVSPYPSPSSPASQQQWWDDIAGSNHWIEL